MTERERAYRVAVAAFDVWLAGRCSNSDAGHREDFAGHMADALDREEALAREPAPAPTMSFDDAMEIARSRPNETLRIGGFVIRWSPEP